MTRSVGNAIESVRGCYEGVTRRVANVLAVTEVFRACSAAIFARFYFAWRITIIVGRAFGLRSPRYARNCCSSLDIEGTVRPMLGCVVCQVMRTAGLSSRLAGVLVNDLVTVSIVPALTGFGVPVLSRSGSLPCPFPVLPVPLFPPVPPVRGRL